jgi:DNA-binding MarR family transcriptional regulator
VLRTILQTSVISESALMKQIKGDPGRIKDALKQLREEGFVRKRRNTYSIS